jgi:hypothetical protein
MTDNIYLEKFNIQSLEKFIKESSLQRSYLFKYLSELGAASIVVEDYYVDRHYIQEFQKYYALSLNAPKNFCKRLLFFSCNIDQKTLDKFLLGEENTIKLFRESFLGFSVIRPVEDVPIGRTVLRTFYEKNEVPIHNYIIRTYTIHLSGIKLFINSLAFQQQDMSVGACATTAVWTALQKVCNANGMRTPTPMEITTLATKYFVRGKSFPANEGLTIEQISEAIRGTGFIPHWVKVIPGRNNRFFKEVMKINLASGIPLVLHIENRNCGHAVCVSGYSEDNLKLTEFDNINNQTYFISKEIDKIYIHDDRYGAYCRANLIDYDAGNGIVCLALEIKFSNTVEQWIIKSYFSPLYEKIRSYDVDLINRIEAFCLYYANFLVDKKYLTDIRILTNGVFLNLINSERLFDESKTLSFLKNVVLSRYIGIGLVSDEKGFGLFGLILDTSDFAKRPYTNPLKGVIGIMVIDSKLHKYFDQFSERGIPVLY